MSLKHSFILLAALSMLATAVACDKSVTEDDGENPCQTVELTTKSASFVEPGNAFAFNFLDKVNAASLKDYVISPLSLQFLLGMLLDGAQNETEAQICRVLGYGAGEADAVDEYCLAMMKQLPTLDKKTTLEIANAIFVDDGWPLLKSYQTRVANYYAAEVSNLDFNNSAKSLKAINGWAGEKTHGMIPKVLDKVDPDMLAYLLNAVYFKSRWTDSFDKDATAAEIFTRENGTAGKVKMMKQHAKFSYKETRNAQVVRLPYGNGAYAMTVVLPSGKAGIADVVASLRGSAGEDVLCGLSTCEVDLWLPRFETKFQINLNDILSKMGIPDAFDESKADFLAMSDYALCLSFVQQDAAITVDEEGTEASAVSTAGIVKYTSFGGAPKNAVFHADHPFLYLITETSTGAILFAGRYSGK